MDQTLKEIYLPYRKKLDQLAEKLAVMLSITEEEALTLIEDQISTEETRWLREEEKNEMIEDIAFHSRSIDVEAE